jgi:hypothetical protein
MTKLWDEHNIIKFHRDTIKEQVDKQPNEVKAAMYAKEIESFKKTNPVQKCMHGIIAREACLKNIVDLQTQISEMQEEENKKPAEERQEGGVIDSDYMMQFVEHLHALRMFSINIVECISAWKDHVLFPWRQEHQPDEEEPFIPFMYQGNNYLLKRRKDNAFLGLRSNPFGQYFNFSERGDPFLVMPSVAAGAGKRRRRKAKKKKEEGITIPIEGSILKKIKKCELVIDAEMKANGLTTQESVN